jgi:hypothetical protein
MGVAIEVLIVDWSRAEAAASGDREDLLSDAWTTGTSRCCST